METFHTRYNLRSQSNKSDESGESNKSNKRKRIFNLSKKEANKKSKVADDMEDFIEEDHRLMLEDSDYESLENNQYFDLDSKPIQDDIIQRLCEKLDVDLESIAIIVKEVFDETGRCLIPDYAGAKPSDNRWKLGLPLGKVLELEPELKLIRYEMTREIPSIRRILEANITRSDKKTCLRYFDRWNNIEPYTSEYYTVMDSINDILGTSHVKRDIKYLEKIEEELRQVNHDSLKLRIMTSGAPMSVRSALYGEYTDLENREPGSQAWASIKDSIEWSLKMPFSVQYVPINQSKEEINKLYSRAYLEMDKELYGLTKVKAALFQIHNDRRTSGNKCRRNIAFKGPPGVGKTQVGKTFAKVMRVPFRKISLSGLKDASVLRGSNKVWQDSGPSLILQEIIKAGSSSCVIMLDEVDKLAKEVQFALLDILDYSNNHEFRDGFLSHYTHDLSEVFFICCMNDEETVAAFKDRLDIIEVSDYTIEDKRIILRDYILPRALKAVGMNSDDITLTSAAIRLSITISCPSGTPGLRAVEKMAKSIVGKINIYNSVLLDDKSTGDLNLNYVIPNFSLPLRIDKKLLSELLK